MRKKAPRLVIAAPSSGSGKTLVTCGLLSALKKEGRRAAAFKCGPDYIDPMFHETVLGTPSKNLDTFFAGEELTRQLFLEDVSPADLSVVEGVMGLYDGLGGVTTRASTWDVARALEAPVILVVDGARSSVSVLALIRGFMDFMEDRRIRGVIFNRVSPMRYPALKTMTEERLGLAVCGYLPKLEGITMESRHLGLVMPQEIEGLKEQMDRLGQTCHETLDLELLEKIGAEAPALEERRERLFPDLHLQRETSPKGPVIAVARDPAFSFYYKDNLRLLEKLGARLIPFSPIKDEGVPGEADALLLGGGYPELHGGELAENVSMRHSIKTRIQSGMPCLAECGGFLYLLEELEDREGRGHRMAGFLPGKSRYTGKLSRFGYVTLTPAEDRKAAASAESGGLLVQGESIRGHEFHYMDTADTGEALLARKPVTGRSWTCGQMGEGFYAGFPHLYLYSCVEMAGRFVRKAEEYGNKRQ